MLTLQHSLITLFALNGNEKQFKEELPYVLLPDAIRKYLTNRKYGHFELSHDKKDVSWLKYPIDIKNLSSEIFDMAEKHLVSDLSPCVLGEITQVESFEKHNSHLPIVYFAGVKKHLIQDRLNDVFIRKIIDCSKMYEDIFVFKGKEYTGTEIRKIISEIENYGFYILSSMLYDAFNITTNQEWFDKNVKPVLDKAYGEELSNATYRFMKIPEDINEKITNHDFSNLDKNIIDINIYLNMYKLVVESMKQVDVERIKKEKTNNENIK
ncbi:MAG: hypothetical protein E7359_01560 [Clostridiales bacterium]|nr:hypothetical protein [Clostridiales bacterium]